MEKKTPPNDPFADFLDPRFSHEAQKKISAALARSSAIRERALAQLETEYRAEAPGCSFSTYLSQGDPFRKFEAEKIESAIVFLDVAFGEFDKFASNQEFMFTLTQEIDSIGSSLDLSTAQRQSLWAEIWAQHIARRALEHGAEDRPSGPAGVAVGVNAGNAAQGAATVETDSGRATLKISPHSRYEVIRRRVIVKRFPRLSSQQLCHKFDAERVELPSRWLAGDELNWTDAYRNQRFRHRIDGIISKDRRS